MPQTPDPAAVLINQMVRRGVTAMEGLAQTLHDNAGAYISNLAVDSTGPGGVLLDFDIRWTSRASLSRAGADGISIYDAVDKQLGLKLELKTVRSPSSSSTARNEKPSDNPPGITTSLPPPPPAEFEVADIKPSMPDTPTSGNILPGGRLDLKGFNLRLQSSGRVEYQQR